MIEPIPFAGLVEIDEDFMEASLEKAIVIAARYHANQVDKGNAPYIFHSLRVMMAMPDIESQIVGVLHDVVEDSDYNLSDLMADGFSENVIAALDAISRRPVEKYADFIERVADNPIAKIVKIADLRDNSNLGRIANPNEADYSRCSKYEAALEYLLES